MSSRDRGIVFGMATDPYVELANDGEVSVCVPLSTDRLAFDYRRAYVRRRIGITQEQFRERCGWIADDGEVKEALFDELGITEKHMIQAMRKARSQNERCQNLRKLVQSCRKERPRG